MKKYGNTYNDYLLGKLREKLTGDPNGCETPLTEWEWELHHCTTPDTYVGTRLTVETHEGQTIVVDHIVPESLVWQALRITNSDGTWGAGPLALSMECEDDKIVSIPHVRKWWTEAVTY